MFAVAAMWTVVTAWYLLTFGLLWFFVIPFRLMRRSQRRREHLAEMQLAAIRDLKG